MKNKKQKNKKKIVNSVKKKKKIHINAIPAFDYQKW